MNHPAKSPLWGVIALAVMTVPFGAESLAQAKKEQKQAEPQKVQLGDTQITADQLDYDLEKKQYIFSSAQKVELISKTSRMTARKMSVQMTPQNQLAWAKCEGSVVVEKKDAEAGTNMTAQGATLDYYEQEQKANLEGDVVVRQESARLTGPLLLTAHRVEMDLKARKNIVHRGPSGQAKAHVQPKGTDGKPAEPVDLTADRIDVNADTQEYVATGKPLMVRPSTRLQARRLRFQVDPEANDVKVAYADGDVIFDSKGDKGSTLHALGDNGSYNKELNQLKLVGNVHAEAKDPGDEKPTIFECNEFEYNTRTGYRKMSGGVKVILPEKPKPAAPAGETAAQTDAGKKSGSDKK